MCTSFSRSGSTCFSLACTRRFLGELVDRPPHVERVRCRCGPCFGDHRAEHRLERDLVRRAPLGFGDCHCLLPEVAQHHRRLGVSFALEVLDQHFLDDRVPVARREHVRAVHDRFGVDALVVRALVGERCARQAGYRSRVLSPVPLGGEAVDRLVSLPFLVPPQPGGIPAARLRLAEPWILRFAVARRETVEVFAHLRGQVSFQLMVDRRQDDDLAFPRRFHRCDVASSGGLAQQVRVCRHRFEGHCPAPASASSLRSSPSAIATASSSPLW